MKAAGQRKGLAVVFNALGHGACKRADTEAWVKVPKVFNKMPASDSVWNTANQSLFSSKIRMRDVNPGAQLPDNLNAMPGANLYLLLEE